MYTNHVIMPMISLQAGMYLHSVLHMPSLSGHAVSKIPVQLDLCDRDTDGAEESVLTFQRLKCMQERLYIYTWRGERCPV